VPNLTRQDGSAMDRLLATRFSSGQLVLRSAGTAPNALPVYEPGQPKTPQAVPRPRGLRVGRPRAGRAAATEGDPPKEQPPPFTWAERQVRRPHTAGQPAA
jgi:integrase